MSAALEEYRTRYRAARARLWGGYNRDILLVSSDPKPDFGSAYIYEHPVGPRRPVFASHVEIKPTTVHTARRIVREMAEKAGTTVEDMLSPRRARHLVAARQELYWRLRNETTWSLPRIGAFLCDRDHTTILSGIKKHQRKLNAEAAN